MPARGSAAPEPPSSGSSEPRFDAFLSYSSADRPLVRRIQRFLESYRPPGRSQRLKVYLDEIDMRGGSLPENLSTALADSRSLVVCWSAAAA
ncbi:MAG TPA: toll/interleukin-1 receptor domain-containing protein [Burkholderiales bacterium]|nr:toll/interleukin-1 receptor domain-containing protein [Burkholderiales bacterium]